MYLIDTHVLSEVRKKSKANAGVIRFFNPQSLTKHLYICQL